MLLKSLAYPLALGGVLAACAFPVQAQNAAPPVDVAMQTSLSVPLIPTDSALAAAVKPARLIDIFGASAVTKSLEMSLAPYESVAADTSGSVLQPVDISPDGRPRTAFRFGLDFIVMPQQTQGARVSVKLPDGVWINYWTGAQMLGGTVGEVEVTGGLPPMWARGGSVIQRRTDGFDSLGFFERRLTGNAKNCGESCLFEVMPAYGTQDSELVKDSDGRTITRAATSLRIQGVGTRAVVRWRFSRVTDVRVNGQPVKVAQSPEGYYATFNHTDDTLVEWTFRGYLSHTY